MAKQIGKTFLEAIPMPQDRSDGPLILPWPTANAPAEFLSFSTVDEWRTFILDLSLRSGVPEIIRTKYQRAQKLYFIGWVDADVIKAGELVAFTALEFALKDRYGKGKFSNLLKRMVENDGLTNELIPMCRKSSSTVIGQLTGQTHTSLAEIRNSLAHGDPYDGLPWAGLLELVRDLIEYAYRNFVTEAVAVRV
jgi:hypothetical protein